MDKYIQVQIYLRIVLNHYKKMYFLKNKVVFSALSMM